MIDETGAKIGGDSQNGFVEKSEPSRDQNSQAAEKKGKKKRESVLEKRFQANLKSMRKTLPKTTQRVFAEILGTTQNYVAQLETGIRGASPAVIERLAHIFKVDPSEFFKAVDPSIVRLPILSGERLGDLRVISENQILGYFSIPRNHLQEHLEGEYICVRAEDDAMAPIIRQGAIVCVYIEGFPSKRSSPTEIYAFFRKPDPNDPDAPAGRLLMRHVRFSDSGQMILLPASIDGVPSNPVIPFGQDDKTMKVVGRVDWIGQPFGG